MAGNILIVDDSAPTLRLLKDILLAEGYAVRPFDNGELALRSLLVEPPELILLDVRMPGLDGFEVCRRIKGEDRLRDIPVIFISAASDTEDKLRAFAAGGVDYITKPFQREEVVARVHTHVALHRAKRQLVEAETARRRSEQSLKIAQAVAHLGHWQMDALTGDVTWSDEMFRIFGFEPQAITPSHEALMNLVHPDDRQRVAGEIEKTRDGGNFDTEFRIALPDGRVRVIHGKGALITFPDSDRRPEIIGTMQHHDNEVIGVIQDITKRKELEWQLEQQARTDALTGCASRRYFMESAHREFSRARRYATALSVLMLDLDNFKAVNDQHGHHVGDLALQKLAAVCRQVLRQEDLAGRLGGEEFAVVLIESGNAKAREVAERLREAVAGVDVPLENRSVIHVTASIGVATMEESDTNVDALLRRADQALYRAKSAGRNRVS